MRAERLVAALLLLQARGRVTAAELADELEISVATARRDLDALSGAGIPVYPQPGRGGGWSLLGGARTDLSGLTAPEAQALFGLLGPTAGVVPEARSALRKLVQALPGTFRPDAEAAARAVVVDQAAWGERDKDRPALVEPLQRAVVGRRKVRLVYAGRSSAGGGGATERLVDPWGLVDKDGVWYLIAGSEAGQRTFRLDRIVEAEVTDLPADRPDDLELADAWQRVVAEVEQRRSGVSATVLATGRLVPGLQAVFGRYAEVLGDAADGRVRVRVAAQSTGALAEQLAGWALMVEVVDPPEVMAELGRIGAALVDRYAHRMPLTGEYEPSPQAWVREQVEEYEASGGERANTLLDTGLPIVLVATRGNKSGKIRKTPLMRVEHDGEYALVASQGGAPRHPVWYFNLKADPAAVTVQDGPEPFDAVVREVEGDERARWWERAVAAYPPYAEYQTRTDRQIPVLVASKA
jgi:deazaflavin-dependent oxidoreductase (nitroreductase family)